MGESIIIVIGKIMSGNAKKIILLIVVLLIIGGAVWFLISKKIISPDIFKPGAKNDNGVTTIDFVKNLSNEDQQKLLAPDIYPILIKMQSACGTLTSDEQQKECQRNFELTQILSLKKAELCPLISKKDDCYLSFAVANKNIALCDQINNDQQKSSCKLTLNVSQANYQGQSLDECRNINEINLKNICISKYIGQQKDLNICNDPLIISISSSSQERCKNTIWFNQAIEKKDKQICNNISDSRIKQTCEAFFATAS